MDDLETETAERSAGERPATETQVIANQAAEPAEPDKIDTAVHSWLTQHIHGSAVARASEAYNHLYRSLDALKAELRQAIKE